MLAELLHVLMAIAVLMLPMAFAWWMVGRCTRDRNKRDLDPSDSRFPGHDEGAIAHLKRPEHVRHRPPRP